MDLRQVIGFSNGKGVIQMKSKRTTGFIIDDSEYVFSRMQFNQAFEFYRKDKKAKVLDLEYDLAEAVSVSREAVHNWRQGYNGPGDLSSIKKMAELLGCNYMTLLEVRKDKKMVNNYTDEQMDSIKKIFDAISDYRFYIDITEQMILSNTEFAESFFGKINVSDYGGYSVNDLGKLYTKIYGTLIREYGTLHNTEIFGEMEKIINDLGIAADYVCKYTDNPNPDENYNIEEYRKYTGVLRTSWEVDIIMKVYNITPEEYENTCENGKLTKRQQAAVKRLYNETLNYIDDVIYSNGYQFEDPADFSDTSLLKSDLFDHVFAKELFDLWNHEVFGELVRASRDFENSLDFLDERRKPTEAELKRFFDARVKTVKNLFEVVDKYC